MKKIEKILKSLVPVLGISSALAFMMSYFIFETLRPKMINFKPITRAEEGLMNYFGIGLLIFLSFCLLSLFQLTRYLKKAKKISLFYLLLLVMNILSLVFIFGDVALLSDIGKQYKYGLSQPEWSILYPVTAFQLVSSLILTYSHVFKLKKDGQTKFVAKDSNIFMVAQYVGFICGSMGLSSTSLGFIFPRSSLWMLKIHTLMGTFILLIPYALILGYWFMIKAQEKTKEWYDEKQIQDLGKSSFLTLISSLAIMTSIFFFNFNSLEGVISVLWFPFYAFLVLLLFSLANLYYSEKN